MSWEKVIFALRKIGKNADAERLQSQYCPEGVSYGSLPSCSSDSAPQAATQSTSAAPRPLPEASQDQPDACGAVLAANVPAVAAQAAVLSDKAQAPEVLKGGETCTQSCKRC